MSKDEILGWLRETDPGRLAVLWERADDLRRRHVGDSVHLRGLIEFSNHCDRTCLYCGVRAPARGIVRYRLDAEEIVACAHQAVALGYGTVVLQSGEEDDLDVEWLAALVERIRRETSLAITLSVGERTEAEYARLRDAGADRYLLRFETSNRELFDRIHPPHRGVRSDRIALLGVLRRLGYEVGSGVMIGIPGQRWEDLARDIELFRELELDMIGLGPYIPHPDTPLGRHPERFLAPPGEQVPADVPTTLRALALARIVCPRANIPATTALATLDPEQGYELALQRGANIIMPNITPAQHRPEYEIYPGKVSARDDADHFRDRIPARIRALGRTVGTGRGDSPNLLTRGAAAAPVGGDTAVAR